MREAELVGLEKKFKLVSSLSTSNIVCFDSEGRIQRYSNIESILTSFYDVRRQWYSKRKKYLINQLTEDYNKADNKVRFVTEIIKGRLVVQGKKKQDIIKDLQQREYKPFFKNSLKMMKTRMKMTILQITVMIIYLQCLFGVYLKRK